MYSDLVGGAGCRFKIFQNKTWERTFLLGIFLPF